MPNSINFNNLLEDKPIEDDYDYKSYRISNNSEEKGIPNTETIAAIEEVQEMKRNPHLYKSFKSVEELFEDLNSKIASKRA